MPHLESQLDNSAHNAPRPEGLDASQYQARTAVNDTPPNASVNAHLPDGNRLLGQLKESDSSHGKDDSINQELNPGQEGLADPERMKSVDHLSTEVEKLLGKGDPEDYNSVQNAAYRYMMNKECVDDYSSTSEADQAIINKADPTLLKKLDDIVAADEKKGPVPGSKCEGVPIS
ncbi:MAG: hypothetical protein KGS72_21265 [Cyanobacteria bacterium REEB67]|nr:hypothetical protein [Cyanobacteria bacterium REEB67]